MRDPTVGRKVIRPAAVAGMFYPGRPELLARAVQQYIDEARPIDLPAPPRAVIAPHAGYRYSGPIAGFAYRALMSLPRGAYTALLMGPAHYVPFHGVAVGSFDAMETPLGTVAVDIDRAHWFIRQGRPFLELNEAHGPEHSLEVQLPFLYHVFGPELKVVPLLFGNVSPDDVVSALESAVRSDEQCLIVVSSDLSHYHPYETARRIDLATVHAIIEGDIPSAREGEACGLIPILALMRLAQRLGWAAHLLDYRNSGDTSGDRSRVVGYAAIAFVPRDG